jgi:hypothetical protein
MKVETCSRRSILKFVEKWHYSKSIKGLRIDQCFKLTNNNELIGAAIFGAPAMFNQWKPYVEKEQDLTELRRLCCIDDTPKNTESFFISRCIKWINRHTDFKKILSYADNDFGHKGVIYQATHFKKIGETKKGRYIMFNGKRYHSKAVNNKSSKYVRNLKAALLNGQAQWINSTHKNIYIYELKSHRPRQQNLENFI